MKPFFALITVVFLSGCSLYESDGRKFLESQAFEFAGVAAQTNLQSCGEPADAADEWSILESNSKADVFLLESDQFELRVVPASNPEFSCLYKFASAQEMYEKSDAAIDLTLYRLSQTAPPKASSSF